MNIRHPNWWAITQKKIHEVLLRWAFIFISPIHNGVHIKLGFSFLMPMRCSCLVGFFCVEFTSTRH